MTTSRTTFSLQIVGSLVLVFGVGLLSLVLVGHNAIKVTDEAALARQERFAARSLAAAIAVIPEQQQSASIWDEAIQNAKERDEQWLDENLGAWMQDYFGHDESYILDQSNEPIFGSIQGKLQPPEAYFTRDEVIAPLATQLRETMFEATLREDDPNAALAEIAVVTPVRLGGEVAIVSVVPIISDTGEMVQEPGTEALHVAVRYVDDKLAQEIGLPIELVNVAFEATPSTRLLAAIPVTGASGEVLTSLVWKPERPGTDLFMNMLPVLLAMAVASGALLFWIVRRMLRISRQLQVSEAQARSDVVAIKEAREAAEVATRAKMNFMSIVSHELRTPLTVILGYARLGKNLRQMPPAKQLRHTLEQKPLNARLLKDNIEKVLETSCTGMGKIERSGEHLLFLVNQLLDYAKIETGRLEVSPEICDVREVLEPVVEQMRILTDQ